MTSASDPTSTARDRVADLLERLARINLQVVVVAPPDTARQAARDRAREVAADAGRSALLDEAVAAARDVTLRAFARGGFTGTWAATETSMSVATAADRVAAAAAFEEAAMAAVVEDRLDPETIDLLRATADELDQAGGLPTPGSLASLASPLSIPARGPGLVVVQVAALLLAGVIAATLGIGFGILALAVGVAVFGKLSRR